MLVSFQRAPELIADRRTGKDTRDERAYGFVYSGAIGVGIGVFNVVDGKISGSDCGGGKYSGTVTDDPATGD